MNFMKQDLKAALHAMGVMTVYGLIMAARVATVIVVGLAVLLALGYVIAHYFLQCLAVMVILALGAWFYIELLEARQTREAEEFEQHWRAEKSKPAHIHKS
jgi:hypothetical protein